MNGSGARGPLGGVGATIERKKNRWWDAVEAGEIETHGRRRESAHFCEAPESGNHWAAEEAENGGGARGAGGRGTAPSSAPMETSTATTDVAFSGGVTTPCRPSSIHRRHTLSDTPAEQKHGPRGDEPCHQWPNQRSSIHVIVFFSSGRP